MKLDYYEPSGLYRSLIKQYEHVRAESDKLSIIDCHIPSGYASLVFNSSGRAMIHEEQTVTLPGHFIVAPLFRAVKIGIYNNIDSFIITCRASVLSRLLSISLSSSQRGYYLRIENEYLDKIGHLFLDYKCAKERISIIEQFFADKGVLRYRPDEIDQLYTIIMEGGGSIPISTHIKQFNRSSRYFRDHFTERIGVNAKTLARIVRVNHLWSMIMNDRAVDFQDMVFEEGYFDQSHLIHDFKKIVGEKPSYFFKRNLDHVKIISGKI